MVGGLGHGFLHNCAAAQQAAVLVFRLQVRLVLVLKYTKDVWLHKRTCKTSERYVLVLVSVCLMVEILIHTCMYKYNYIICIFAVYTFLCCTGCFVNSTHNASTYSLLWFSTTFQAWSLWTFRLIFFIRSAHRAFGKQQLCDSLRTQSARPKPKPARSLLLWLHNSHSRWSDRSVLCYVNTSWYLNFQHISYQIESHFTLHVTKNFPVEDSGQFSALG